MAQEPTKPTNDPLAELAAVIANAGDPPLAFRVASRMTTDANERALAELSRFGSWAGALGILLVFFISWFNFGNSKELASVVLALGTAVAAYATYRMQKITHNKAVEQERPFADEVRLSAGSIQNMIREIEKRERERPRPPEP